MYQCTNVEDVWIDGVVKSLSGESLFVSMIGSESEMQSMIARASLNKNHSDFLSEITFDVENKSKVFKFPKEVEKTTARMKPDAKINGVHGFFYSRNLLPQYAEPGKGILLLEGEVSEEEKLSRLWRLINDVSYPPLFEHWQQVVIDVFEEQGWVKPLESYGRISAFSVELPIPEHVDLIERLIKSGQLKEEK